MSERTLWGKSCGLDDRKRLQGLMSTSSLKTSSLLILGKVVFSFLFIGLPCCQHLIVDD